MTEPIDGRELLAIRARTGRARIGGHQSLRQTEADRETLLREVYRLRGRVEQAEAVVERIRDLCHQPYTAAYDLAADVLAELPCRPNSAPESNAPASSPVSTPTETHGETGEAQEG